MNTQSLIDTLAPIFQKLDLSEDEAEVLSVMTKLGSRPVSAIAKAVGFGRGKTYNIIAQLKENQFVQEVVKNGASAFSAIPPEALIQRLSEREKELSGAKTRLLDLLPLLATEVPPESSSAKVEFWKGDSALQMMLDKILLEKNSEIFAFLDYEKRWPTGRGEDLIEWDREYTKRRVAQNIPFYAICNKSEASDQSFRERKACKRYMKIVSGTSFPVAIVIHRTRLIITRNGAEVFGVAICDPIVVGAAIELFRSIWKDLTDYRLAGVEEEASEMQ